MSEALVVQDKNKGTGLEAQLVASEGLPQSLFISP